MKQNFYPIDNSAILYLAQMGPDHANIYRFTITLAQPVDPALLQQAADRICPRFPTIVAGFRPGFFDYQVIPAAQAPRVAPDPGLLHTMSRTEIGQCAYRVYYDGCQIIMEAFHALTDGYGAVASLRALLGEYLFLRHGIASPERESFLMQTPDWDQELQDAYLQHSQGPAGSLPRCPSYQLTAQDRSSEIRYSLFHASTQALREAARREGVSMTVLLSGLMAEAIMEVQALHRKPDRPVRIMVPIDLRRKFPSKTFRNFILYALPTLKPEEASLPRRQRLASFRAQLEEQTQPEFLQAQIARNVRLQSLPAFRLLPRAWKSSLMRLSYRFFGEINSSITLTNLGALPLSEALRAQIRQVDVFLTPRRISPYNCGILSLGDTTSICLTRFGTQTELEDRFFRKLEEALQA